eukprot:66700-Chlamydomonas_euryale.AAC.2
MGKTGKRHTWERFVGQDRAMWEVETGEETAEGHEARSGDGDLGCGESWGVGWGVGVLGCIEAGKATTTACMCPCIVHSSPCTPY